MVWVRSEYAGELAVLSAWLAALIPWNVTISSAGLPGRLLSLRFPFFEVQYLMGFEVDGRSFFLLGIGEAISQQAGQTVHSAYLAWAAGTILIAGAVCVGIAYYLAEERVEGGPVDPILLIGGLLAGAGAVLTVASVLLVTTGVPGISIPIGAVLLVVIGVILLAADRR